MSPLSVVALVCTLCVAGIGALYFVWVRKSDRTKQAVQPHQHEQK
ncbi:MAG TPA: hypothetical protein VMS17_08185 [Gemmataceae bacterium]|nr:hypothetical protein [Gemmataceae bacterium]